jgi:nucleoid DNA-binding protein
MARILAAVSVFGPRIRQRSSARTKELAEWISRSSGLNPNQVQLALGELSDAIIFYLAKGMPVSIDGVGRVLVTVSRRGDRRVRMIPAGRVKQRITDNSYFNAAIDNEDRIGWTDADYKAAWDAAHPDNPLEIDDEPSEPEVPVSGPDSQSTGPASLAA